MHVYLQSAYDFLLRCTCHVYLYIGNANSILIVLSILCFPLLIAFLLIIALPYTSSRRSIVNFLKKEILSRHYIHINS